MSGMTPLMRQYTQIKSQYPDAILFFRMGDFYEMFNEDAKVASRALQISLTKRGKSDGMDIPLCGFPYHAAEPYIAKLIRQGYKVAVCEQVEDPKKAKGIVKREVIRVVTPGTVLDEGMQEARENLYVASFVQSAGGVGLALIDLTTGEFLLSETDRGDLEEYLLARFGTFEPREVVVPEEMRTSQLLEAAVRDFPDLAVQYMDGWTFETAEATRKLTEHFETSTLRLWGCPARDCRRRRPAPLRGGDPEGLTSSSSGLEAPPGRRPDVSRWGDHQESGARPKQSGRDETGLSASGSRPNPNSHGRADAEKPDPQSPPPARRDSEPPGGGGRTLAGGISSPGDRGASGPGL